MKPDDLVIRCPRLGSDVGFGYCRASGDGQSPCFKVFDCWWETFDVAVYFKERLPGEEFEKLVHSKPKPKVLSLLELIEQARRNAGGNDKQE
ncbi:MAG: hypothetical protein EHM30_06370 [Desulfobacteraceae bacterium]|jgi:hypothetical protein|nr:MAG: hypothetical protein EHM30_06370 [Desulfobacteraceae bacterium]